MPPDVRRALTETSLLERYRARPAYQQNDYLSWVNRAKRQETRQKRLDIMLDDLRRGDRYMGMLYNARRKRKSG